MNQETIIVDNLKCGGCANTIEKELVSMNGVQQVTINIETSTLEIEKEDFISRTTLLEKLSKLGYPELGTSNLMQTAKSYISCAIGRLDT